MTHEIITTNSPERDLLQTKLIQKSDNKDARSRIGQFIEWMVAQGATWMQPDLEAYRDYLLERGLSKLSTRAHLSTIRARYQDILKKNETRDELYAMTPDDASPADRKAFVDEVLARLQNATHHTTSEVEITTEQDESDTKHLRLKPHEVETLLKEPGIDTLRGMRDTAMIAVMVCTAVREAELCDIVVDDLRDRLTDEVALNIPRGKGNKKRIVPYGPLDWCLVYVDMWMTHAGIEEGPVFCAINKGKTVIRDKKLTTRSVNRMLDRYPIVIDGELRVVRPHDLRRTYARNAYESGMEVTRIQQNLGHSSIQTTLTYVGQLDGKLRRPPQMYRAPHDARVLQTYLKM